MKKEKMVTRTITSTRIEFLAMDVETEQTSIQSIIALGDYSSNVEAMKYLRETLDSDVLLPIKIRSAISTDTLYGMTEREFVMNAKPLTK